MTREDAGFEGPTAAHVDDAVRNQALIFKDTFPGMLGVTIVEATAERALATLDVGPQVRHPGGYAHGGALAGFGDTVAAWATFPNLSEGQGFTTIEFKCNFISGVKDGRLEAVARVVHRGRRTIVLEVKMTAGDKLVAIMLVTQAVLGEAAAGHEEPPE
jgi:uncharacterized protein (TIGR00369 family)